jgi:hypothetical protein
MMEFINRMPDGAVLTISASCATYYRLTPWRCDGTAFALASGTTFGAQGERVTSVQQIEEAGGFSRAVPRVATAGPAPHFSGGQYASADETLARISLRNRKPRSGIPRRRRFNGKIIHRDSPRRQPLAT